MGVLDFINRSLSPNVFAEKKSVPTIDPFSMADRGGLPKAYIPNFLYRPPFGYPRYINVPNIRRLAAMPYVEMCIRTIIAECQAVPWDIIVKKDMEYSEQEMESKKEEIEEVKHFFMNPNTNKESFEQLDSKITRDVLEIDSGVLVKIFNKAGEMVEIVARDGGLFTKNPDVYGMITNRDDIIFAQMAETYDEREGKLPPGYIGANDMREKAAYFQYGWMASGRPVPFGKREVVWFEQNVRADDIYGRSPVENLLKTIQMLIYAIDNNLEYFTENSIPKGIIGLEGSDSEEIEAFSKQWKEQQRKLDEYGNWRKVFWQPPIINKKPEFEKIEWSAAELQLIDQQKWFSKLVWASFGVTPSELGYTEDSNNATEIVQSRVFRRKAINPILKMKEWKFNHEILIEWRENAKKKAVATHMQETESEYVRKKLETDRAKEERGAVTHLNEKKAREEFQKIRPMFERKVKEEVDKMAAQGKLPYHGIEFKYLMFDVDEETKKWELYKMQLETKAKTINEIRLAEGENPVDWGSQPADYNQNINLMGADKFGMGSSGSEKPGQSGSEQDSGKKPFGETNKDPLNDKKKDNPAFGQKSGWIEDNHFQSGNLSPEGEARFKEILKKNLGMGMTKEEAEQNAWSEIRNLGLKAGGTVKELYAHERFDLKDAVLLNRGGSDRSAYLMPDGKILKIVKSARGLGQNEMEGAINLCPILYEKGKDYVLVEKCDRNDEMSDNMLQGVQRFTSEDWKVKTKDLLDEIDRLCKEYPTAGFKEVLNYDLIFGDFKKAKNWGWKGTRPYMIDAGTLNREELDKGFIEHLQPEWFEIVKARREARDAGNKVLMKSKIEMDKDELVEEHRHLVQVLESGTDEERKKEAEKQKKELLEYEQKAHVNFDQNNENYNPESLDTLYTSDIKKKHPLILTDDEIADEDKLSKALKFLINKNKNEIIKFIDAEVRPDKVSEIKSVESFIEAVKRILNFGGAKQVSDLVIKAMFLKGWDKSEKQLDRNLMLNREAIDFIQKYTFENIKGMTDDLVNGLRQELQRGIIEGEGAFKLKDRVNKVFDAGETRAEAIARTESNRAENQGRLLAFKESGEEYEKKWISHIDDRTSDLCKHLNGKTVGLNDKFKFGDFEGVGPPGHVNCRSQVVFVPKKK